MSTNQYADTVFYNGVIYTVDKKDSIHSAIALHNGFIKAVGTDEEILKLVSPKTEKIDLEGKMIMPGIVDCHMHPLWGAKRLVSHSLNYEALNLEQVIERIEGFLKSDGDLLKDIDWLVVRGWLRVGGVDVFRWDLDKIDTKRPIILFSTDCHFIALNSRGLELLGIDENTPEPDDGHILRDENKKPNGIVEDAPAMRYFDQVTHLSGQQIVDVLMVGQAALHKQGVTTILDARSLEEEFEGFAAMRDQGNLKLRVMAAREIKPRDCPTPEDAEKAVIEAGKFLAKYNAPDWSPEPDIGAHTVKFFVDGMITNYTAYSLTPYYDNKGTEANPDWQLGTCRGKGVPYFSEEKLTALYMACAKHGFQPHMHVIADGTADIVLNAVEKVRKAYPDLDFRPILAHDDIIRPNQYKRYAELGAYPVLSFQWAGQPADLIEFQRGLLGPERFEGLEPHGKFFDAGVKVAYGSDWPVDELGEWHNFQVGLTRKMPDSGGQSFPRMESDRNLTVPEVLRAATINAAETIYKEHCIGSLEPGKFADLIVVDRNLLTTPADHFEQTKVLRTVVGGETVYKA